MFSTVCIANGELYGMWNKLKQLSCRSSCKCVGMKEIRGEERDLIKYILFWNYSIIKILSIMSTDDIEKIVIFYSCFTTKMKQSFKFSYNGLNPKHLSP